MSQQRPRGEPATAREAVAGTSRMRGPVPHLASTGGDEGEPLPPRAAAGGEAHLHRLHTVRSLTALGVGGIVGSGIFVMTGMASALAGPALVVSCLVSAAAALAAALCFAEAAARVPSGGSIFAYVRAAFGEGAGWLAGWNFLLAIAVAGGSVAAGWSQYLRELLRALGATLPEALARPPLAVTDGRLVTTGAIADLWVVLVLLVLALVAARGLRQSLIVNGVVLAVKLTVLMLVVVVGAAYVRPEHWVPFAPLGWGIRFEPGAAAPVGMLAGAALLFYAFLGFEAVSAQAEEAKDPTRDVPRATLASVLLVTLLYVAVIAVVTGMVPYRELDAEAPLAAAFRRVGLAWAGALVALGALAALTNVLLVILMTMARVVLAMARAGVLPARLGRVHPVLRTPVAATAASALAMGMLGALIPLRALADAVILATLLGFAGVALAVLALRRRQERKDVGLRLPGAALAPAAALAICSLMAASLPPLTILGLLPWYALGWLVYRARRSAAPA
jgi:APA family basic amino acid/polyamine antiporter